LSLLRVDLLRAMDTGTFAFVPKCGKWVVHMLAQTNHIGRDYQNVELRDLHDVASQFLLTRFAWAIFPLLENFLSFPIRRHLTVFANSSNTGDINSTGQEQGWRIGTWKSEMMFWKPVADDQRSKSSSPLDD